MSDQEKSLDEGERLIIPTNNHGSQEDIHILEQHYRIFHFLFYPGTWEIVIFYHQPECKIQNAKEAL